MDKPPKVLVAYATATGSTKDVPEFAGATLRDRGCDVDVSAAIDEVPGPARYDAVVVGSAVHNQALLPAVTRFAREHRELWPKIPVWLFSVGIGPSLSGPLARWVPPRIAAVRDILGAQEYRAFAGIVDRATMPPVARVILRLLGGRYGDLRDWTEIERWVDGIAEQVLRPDPTTPGSSRG